MDTNSLSQTILVLFKLWSSRVTNTQLHMFTSYQKQTYTHPYFLILPTLQRLHTPHPVAYCQDCEPFCRTDWLTYINLPKDMLLLTFNWVKKYAFFPLYLFLLSSHLNLYSIPFPFQAILWSHYIPCSFNLCSSPMLLPFLHFFIFSLFSLSYPFPY